MGVNLFLVFLALYAAMVAVYVAALWGSAQFLSNDRPESAPTRLHRAAGTRPGFATPTKARLKPITTRSANR